MNALIIVNGQLPAMPILIACRQRCELLLCADGGANRAVACELHPDYIVGDLDSVAAEVLAQLPLERQIRRPSQYATDLEKTLDFLIELGGSEAVLLGVTGYRLDHLLVNLNMVEKFSDRLTLEVQDDYGTGNFISARQHGVTKSFTSFLGQQVSLIAFRRADGIATTGLQYPLHDEALEWAIRDGLSNVALGDSFSVSVRTGNLFCYRVRREPGVL